MLSAIETLKKVQMYSSRTMKKELLRSCKDKHLKEILYYSYNPFHSFHIAKNIMKRVRKIGVNFCETYRRGMDNNSPEDVIMEEIGLMSKRNSVNEGDIVRFIAMMNYADNTLSEDEPMICTWLMQIILKDLRCGINIETINSVFPNLIPEFKVQLAEPFERYKSGTYFFEPKLDGVRCIAKTSIQNGTCELRSRNGELLLGYNEIEKDVVHIASCFGRDIVLDGEIMSKNFDATMEGLFSKESNKKATYSVFDGMVADAFDYKTGSYPVRLVTRKSFIKDLFEKVLPHPISSVKLISHEIINCSSEDDMLVQIKNYTDEYIAQGYEGLMIKHADSFYNFKRTFDWQKSKRFHSVDAKISGFLEGEDGSKFEGTLGAIIVKYKKSMVSKKYEPDNFVETKVGSGFDDSMRDYIWNNRGDLIGTTVEVKYQEITKDFKLRFPVFVKLRKDK